MLKIKFKVDDADTRAQLRGLSIDAHVQAWGEAVLRFTREKAREKIGGPFGERIAKSVDVQTTGLQSVVAPNQTEGYIGEAVHAGGLFRARSGKLLAVPIHPLTQKGGTYAGIFPRVLEKKGVPLFLLASKKRNQLFLFREPEKGQKLQKPLFVLKRTTRHAPRPWWPTGEEVNTATLKFFDENF